MISWRSFGLALALGAALPGVAAAQSPFTFGLGGSLNVGDGSTGTLGDGSLFSSWQGMGLLQIRPFSSRFGFQLDGTYQAFSPAGLVTRQQFNGTANVLYEFGRTRTSKVVPYVIGGAGVYSFAGRGADGNAYHVGLNGGAGLNLRLFGPGSFFLESRFHNVFNAGLDTDGTGASARLIPITAGFKFSGP